MFGAMFRWVKAVGYLMTGQIDAARRSLDLNPHVMGAKYDEVLSEKTGRIQTYKQAVAGLIAQEENKLAKIKALTDEVNKIENLRAGALAKAKKRVEQLQGTGAAIEAIHKDEEYMRCQAAFRDFSSTLTEKQARIEELEGDVNGYRSRISEHKVQLQSLVRELDQLRGERADAVADVITAKEEKDIADMLSGIANDGTAQELQRMRQLRQEIKAEAKISKELAGTDTKVQEAEFLAYARSSESDNEFDNLIGLAAKADGVAVDKPVTESKLPE